MHLHRIYVHISTHVMYTSIYLYLYINRVPADSGVCVENFTFLWTSYVDLHPNSNEATP
jgi:hypothetical protein